MNLINGKLMNDAEAEAALSSLPELVFSARTQAPPSPEEVIRACDMLSRRADEGRFLPLLEMGGMTREKAVRSLAAARLMMSGEHLRERLSRELGPAEERFVPQGSASPVLHRRMPLGTLFHIAAGNVDALPVFSVIEGLLTGNVNILKLPSDDGGLSVTILQMLFEAEPKLSERVFVFDFPSQNTAAMERMAAVSDAVVVWGGDEAVRAVRKLALPDTAIIEWGHKLSFAYASGEVTDAELEGLCRNICDTEQLYCSSCQGVYVDTRDESALHEFALRFADALERTCEKYPSAYGADVRAQKTLELYTDELESLNGSKRVLRRNGCAVVETSDPALEPSHMFRTPWVKPLPRDVISRTLMPNKGRLQTAALLCPERSRGELSELLFRAGVVRIAPADLMSETYCGMPHDGRMPLSLYTRIVSEG